MASSDEKEQEPHGQMSSSKGSSTGKRHATCDHIGNWSKRKP